MMNVKREENEKQVKQPYSPPEIVLEILLETRAGTPLSNTDDPLDLTGIGTGTDILP